ncbi:MAG: prohibitin family protein [Ruminococcus sp.]|nr:prohibitin family protein [Ruminococcus sp.]
MQKKNIKTLIISAVIVVLLLIITASTITIVPAGTSGVVVTMGKVGDHALDSGLHFRIPFVQSVVMMNNKIQKCEVESNSVSKDLQTVSSAVAVNFHITSDSASNIYKTIGEQYQDTVLQPAIQEAVKSISAQYTAEELITKRTAVGDEIGSALTEKVSDYGIIIDKFNIVNFEFSEEFNVAIEQKQVAEQNYLKAQTEKEQQIMEAEADAKKQVIAAEAEAEATLKKAEAEAEANEKINASLNGNILTYQQIQKWDGKYPSVVSSDSSVLIDIPKSSSNSVNTQSTSPAPNE